MIHLVPKHLAFLSRNMLGFLLGMSFLAPTALSGQKAMAPDWQPTVKLEHRYLFFNKTEKKEIIARAQQSKEGGRLWLN